MPTGESTVRSPTYEVLRRVAFHDPGHQGAHVIEPVGARPTATMAHTRHHEKTEELAGVDGSAIRRLHVGEVIDDSAGPHGIVVPALDHQQLASTLAVLGKVRRVHVEDGRRPFKIGPVVEDIKGRRIVVLVLVYPIAQVLFRAN